MSHKYPSLVHASLKSACSTKAIVTCEGSLSYGELKNETERMMADWRFDLQRPVVIRAEPTLKGFTALHALNRLGVTVAFRAASHNVIRAHGTHQKGD